MGKKEITFTAYLDSGANCEVTYITERNFGNPINELKRVVYRGMDITPCLNANNYIDTPYPIYKAIENNSKHVWETELLTS